MFKLGVTVNKAIRAVAATATVVFAIPLPSFASCTSALVATPTVASTDATLSGVGGSGDSDVWAVGGSYVSPTSLTLIEHYTGNSWAIVPSPNVRGSTSDNLDSVTAVSRNDAWAVGTWCSSGCGSSRQLAEHWNGVTWTLIPSNSFNDLLAVSSVAGDPESVWAVGLFTYPPNCRVPAGCAFPIAMRWQPKGSRWVSEQVPVDQDPGVGELNSVVSLPDGSAWAVGSDEKRDYSNRPLVERWTGREWTIVRSAVTSGILTSVAATNNSDVWVGGVVNFHYGRHLRSFVEHWNGSTWTVLDLPELQGVFLTSVEELSPSNVWIAGHYNPTLVTNSELPFLEHFDGSSWSVIATAANGLQSEPAGLFHAARGVWAVGSALPSEGDDLITYATLTRCK